MATFFEIETPDADEPRDPQRLVPGVRASLIALIGLTLALALPYGVVWVAGEGAARAVCSVRSRI